MISLEKGFLNQSLLEKVQEHKTLPAQSNLIPNTTLVIYTSAQEYNKRGDRNYWVSVVDLSSNKLIKQFGSNENPLSKDNAVDFIGFTEENQPIYFYGGKYYEFEITSGTINPLSKLPFEIISEENLERNN